MAPRPCSLIFSIILLATFSLSAFYFLNGWQIHSSTRPRVIPLINVNVGVHPWNRVESPSHGDQKRRRRRDEPPPPSDRAAGSNCASRRQEGLLRSPAGRKRNLEIPGALLDAWKRYAGIHSQCVNDLLSRYHADRDRNQDEDRNRDRDRDLESGRNGGGGGDPCKYVLVSDAELVGLGNRLVALASALAFAMATDRAILIDNRRNLGDLLCEPLFFSTWLLPPALYSTMDGAKSMAEIAATFTHGQGVDDGSGSTVRALQELATGGAEMAVVKVRLWDEPGEGDMEVFRDEVYEALGRVECVVWQSDLYTVPNLFLVRGFWERWVPWIGSGSGSGSGSELGSGLGSGSGSGLGSGLGSESGSRRLGLESGSGSGSGSGHEDGVFGLLTRLALMPSDGVWRIVAREYLAHVGGAKRTVGVQVRLHGGEDRAAFREAEYGRMLACLRNRSYLQPPPPNEDADDGDDSDADDSSSSSLDRYAWRLETGNFRPDLCILVASLQGQYHARLKAELEGDGDTAGIVRVHSVSALEKQDFGLRQAELALAEMWLLSAADALATSASSTFGYAAHAWARLAPLILDFPTWRHLQQQNVAAAEGAPCELGYSPDPCSHLPRTPRGFDSSGLAPAHQRWLRRHVRICQDRPQAAWQLVGAAVPESRAPPPPPLLTLLA